MSAADIVAIIEAAGPYVLGIGFLVGWVYLMAKD